MASRGRGRGKRARVGTSTPSIPPIPGYEEVVLANQNQRNRFISLRGTIFNPTRFLSTNDMVALGLDDALKDLFVNTGLQSFYGMQELTYYSLTLEFLSSLKMDKDTDALSFRVQNEDYTLTLAQFGTYFSLGRSILLKAPAEFDGHLLWSCISDIPLTRGYSNARVNNIQHPVLRIWFRTVIGTAFGRSEYGNLNLTELSILGSYLNVQRGDRFALDLPYLVAKHMVGVAEGRIKTIEIGGLITFLVKKMGFDCGNLEPLDADERWIDRNYMRSCHKWLHRDPSVCRWAVSKGPPVRYLNLPCDYLPPLCTLHAGEGVGLPSYLIPEEGQNMLVVSGQQQRRSRTSRGEASSSNPPPTQQEMSMAHFNFQRQQFTHFAVNHQLASYEQYHRNVEDGLAQPPHPSYYRGASSSGIFEEAGIDPNAWNPSYHESFGGFGGQLLDEFGRMNLGGGNTEFYGDDPFGEDADEE